MKKIIFIILFLINICSAQVDYSNGKAIIDSVDWCRIRDKFIKLNYENAYKDSIINLKDSIILQLKRSEKYLDSLLRIKENSNNELINFLNKINFKNNDTAIKNFEFYGVFLGFETLYRINSENSRTQFYNRLEYGLFLNLGLRVKKIRIEPEIYLPFRLNETIIKFKLSYKLF